VARPKPPRAAGPAPIKKEAVAAGAACAPQPQPQVDACLVLGAKNAMLREQLGQIEEKVRVLQVAAGAAPAPVPQPVKVHKPKKKKPEPPPEAATSWLLVGGAGAAVLALLAGLVVALRRRKKPRRAAVPRVGLMARLKARFGRKPARLAVVEPTMDEAARESSTQV
jgi:pilus assembly protein FimV